MDDMELSTPTLMRAARGVYARAIRAELYEIGINDLPRNGAFILAGIGAGGRPRTGLPAGLEVSKQAVSQVTDILVSRGYVTRGADPDDRRRIVLELTERGQEVVNAVVRGVDAVDARLRERASAEQIEAMRSALGTLGDIKVADEASGAGRPLPARQFRRFSPIFPVRDLSAALAHYAALGFDTRPYEDGSVYGFASREGTELHLEVHPDHEPGHDPGHGHGLAYLYVRDADELYAEWSRPGIGGQIRPVEPTEYKMRQGAHVDPDGNVIRFGSFVAE